MTLQRQSVQVDPELGTVRWCPRCSEWWPDDVEFFYPERRHDRLIPRCRACRREAADHYREANRELIRERDRQLYERRRVHATVPV